jgi:hypothetical protein
MKSKQEFKRTTAGRTHLKGLGLAALGLGMLFLPAAVTAQVSGPCSDCHTMHNSQDGTPMATIYDEATGTVIPDATPNEVLLLGDCIACHTGTNDGINTTPYINTIGGAANYGTNNDGTTGANTLAGGNFYWVTTAGDDTYGHNVDGLAGLDGNFGDPLMPPGGTAALTSQLTCAGTTGCHGDRTVTGDFGAISGAHHGNVSGLVTTANTVGNSYRFLLGVHGNEDGDREYQATAAAHNQYKGADRTNDTVDDTTTISSLCAQCHNDFHNGSGEVGGSNPGGTAGAAAAFASPWVRHPTDFDMGNTAVGSEYRSYGGGTNAYVPAAPVASSDVSAILTNVTFTDDTIVNCISCHRAHATPYADILRWDYSTINAGGGASHGCFECHTTKN